MNQTLQNSANLFNNIDINNLSLLYADYFIYSVVFSIMILLLVLKEK